MGESIVALRNLNLTHQQRFPIAFQAFFATVSLIGMLVLPDTPRWYYAQGREASGDDVLMRLHDLPLEHEKVQEMKSEILASIKFEEEEKNKFRLLDLIWDRSEIRAGRRIRIAFMILSIQQMMGINLAVYYSTVSISIHYSQCSNFHSTKATIQ